MLRLTACLVFFCSLIGCSSGFNRTEIAKELNSGPYDFSVKQAQDTIGAEDIRSAFELKPQLKFPFKIAIRFVPSSDGFWRWTDEDKKRLETWSRKLKKRGIVSDVFLLSDIVVRDESLSGLRLAAAQHGADTLLIVKAATDLDRYTNPSALFYLTLVGCFLAPGSHLDGLMVIKGAMYDVRNEYLYLTAEAEGESKSWGPLAFIDEKKVFKKAKSKALASFGNELIQRISTLR